MARSLEIDVQIAEMRLRFALGSWERAQQCLDALSPEKADQIELAYCLAVLEVEKAKALLEESK